MKKLYYTILVLTVCFGTLQAQDEAQVSAYQAGAYQPGIMNIRDLAVVGAGLIFIDYNYWNNSSSYYDRNGNEVKGFDVPSKGHIDLSQQVGGYTNVPVVFWASKFKILGARYMATFAPSYLSSNYKMNIHIDKNNQDASSTGNAAGWGDMAIMPLGLGWTIGDNVDLSFFYTMYVPTGKYENGGSDNIGRGYWTHQFQVPFYYYIMEKSTAFFVMPTYEINGKIEDSDVKPGSRMTLEYGISQYVTPWLELEVLNGHNWQVGNDDGNDVWWRDTPMYTKDKTSTVSFGVGVWPWEGRLNIRAKYVMDYGVEQRYKSNFWSLSAIFIPNILN
jgi:hypothetical protein